MSENSFLSEVRRFEKFVKIKADLIANGINVASSFQGKSNFNTKQIHLYQHHSEAHMFPIPEDIYLYRENQIINKSIVSKLRYNPRSNWTLHLEDEIYFIENPKTEERFEVQLTAPTNFDACSIEGTSLNKIVQKLGKDVAGVILSNYCFYYKDGKECKFCEIYQTFKKHKTHKSAIKPVDKVIEGLKQAFALDPDLKYVLLNSGNITSYDYTAGEFIKIARGIKSLKDELGLDIVAILMPPENFSLMDEMKEAGIDKVYYDIEVFNYELFKKVCPGKSDYGYENMLQALEYGANVFGKGSSYSSFIYGIQHLPLSLDTTSWDGEQENEKALYAVDQLLARNIVPLFCVYHFSGYNQIGQMQLDADKLFEFSCQYGQKVAASGIIPHSRDSVVYSSTSVTNTLLNDGYNLALLNTMTHELVR